MTIRFVISDKSSKAFAQPDPRRLACLAHFTAVQSTAKLDSRVTRCTLGHMCARIVTVGWKIPLETSQQRSEMSTNMWLTEISSLARLFSSFLDAVDDKKKQNRDECLSSSYHPVRGLQVMDRRAFVPRDTTRIVRRKLGRLLVCSRLLHTFFFSVFRYLFLISNRECEVDFEAWGDSRFPPSFSFLSKRREFLLEFYLKRDKQKQGKIEAGST